MSSVQSLIASLKSNPPSARERPLEGVPTRQFDCQHLLAMCKEEEANHTENVPEPLHISDGIPEPAIDEQITRPYPSEDQVPLMVHAERASRQDAPRVAQAALPGRTTLPGVRSAHASRMEAVLVLAGAVVLPILTFGSLHALGSCQARQAEHAPAQIAAPIAASNAALQQKAGHTAAPLKPGSQ